MTEPGKRASPVAELRERIKRFDGDNYGSAGAFPVEDVKQLVLELETVQIELERKSERLRDTEKELAGIYDLVPVGYLTITAKGEIIECDLAAAEMLGESRDVVQDGLIDRYVFPEDLDTFYQYRSALLRASREQRCELRLQKKTGESQPVCLDSLPTHGRDGNEENLRLRIRDIGPRKTPRGKVWRGHKLWEQAFNRIPDMVIMLDADMNIVLANHAAKKLYQKKSGLPESMKCYEAFNGVSSPCPGCPAPRALTDGRSHSAVITNHKLERTLHVNSSLIEKREERKYLINICRDITEQRTLDEATYRAHKMDAIGRIAGGVAHEFNNILTIILGMATFVKTKIPKKSSARENVNHIIDASNRAVELVKQLLLFSGRKEFHPQNVRVELLVEKALKIVRSTLPPLVQLDTAIESECGHVFADPASINYVLLNLCTNAIEAMRDHPGTLFVAVYQAGIQEKDRAKSIQAPGGNYVVLSVSDTGCGMDAATIKKIFEPFFTTKDIGEGPGLGLSVIHGIVQGFGGFIEVESQPGEGSCFSVYIPQLHGAEAHLPVDVQENHGGDAVVDGGKCVLVVDDEPVILELYQYQVEACGYQVVLVQDGEEALKHFREHPDRFDLLITDYFMPTMNGDELSRRVLEIRPDLPIVMISGQESTFTEQQALSIGIARYMTKPVTQMKFAKSIRELLENQEG